MKNHILLLENESLVLQTVFIYEFYDAKLGQMIIFRSLKFMFTGLWMYMIICVCMKIISRLYAYKFAFTCVYVIYYSFLFARISLLMCVCEVGYVFVYEHIIDSFMRLLDYLHSYKHGQYELFHLVI